MAILAVYLRLKGLVLLFVFIHFVNILLFYPAHFTFSFGHYIEENICFYSFRINHWEIFYQ